MEFIKRNVLYDLKGNPQRTGRSFASSVKSALSVQGMMLLVQRSTVSLGGGGEIVDSSGSLYVRLKKYSVSLGDVVVSARKGRWCKKVFGRSGGGGGLLLVQQVRTPCSSIIGTYLLKAVLVASGRRSLRVRACMSQYACHYNYPCQSIPASWLTREMFGNSLE